MAILYADDPADAATDVGAVFARRRRDRPRPAERRLTVHCGHHLRQRERRQQVAVALRVRAGAHQYPGAQPRQYRRQLRGAAGAEHEPVHGGEVEVHGAGKTAWNFVDCLGSAIMPATVSRQVA